MLPDALPQVTNCLVHLTNHVFPLLRLGAIFVSCGVGLSKIKGHKVDIVLGEPLHDEINVLLPLSHIVVLVKETLYSLDVHLFPLVGGVPPREKKRGCLQTLG